VGGNNDSNNGNGDQRPEVEESETRPQRGGEAGTTRFGMEEGDNTDIPSTGGPSSDEQPDARR
jgi:hypothetical protein